MVSASQLGVPRGFWHYRPGRRPFAGGSEERGARWAQARRGAGM